MKKQTITLLFLILLWSLNGCGGADPIADEDVEQLENPLADKEPPRFITFDSELLEENQKFVKQVSATDENEVSYHITGGIDAHLFTLDKDLGLLSFKEAPQFDTPQDSDQDNRYQVTISAQDEEGNADFQNLLIEIEKRTADNNAS